MLEKTKVALPERPDDAINKLFDAANRDKTEKIKDAELPLFQIYLNYAVTNLQEIAGPSVLPEEMFEPENVEKRLLEASKDVIQKLANFLWLFKVDNPEDDFGKEYKKITIQLVTRIFKLRNFFCHQNREDIEPLKVKHDFYQFFAGWLHGEITLKALKNVSKANKIFEMKLLNPQEIDDEGDRSKNIYAFTRKGIILLICMALYKDDAHEFCQGMHDMKLLNRELEEELNEDGLIDIRKKIPSSKAFHEAFTYFSMKRSYGKFDQEQQDFACFADILGYLNKVPSVSLDYLALAKERQMLAELAAKSTESEDNKRCQYALHRRMKDRFLSFLVAYCEDFKLLPSMHFKRLDISEHIGRKRYCFGDENDNAVRQSRHYDIKKDAIRFEFRPQHHEGQIHISSLRSSISADELRRLVVANITGIIKVDQEVQNYFSAYHRVLERMLNEPECNFIDRTPYLEDLSIVTCAPKEELAKQDEAYFLSLMKDYFPENLSRFFIPKDNIPSEDELRKKLNKALDTAKKKAKDLLERLQKLDEQRKAAYEGKDEATVVKERMPSDGFLISQIFKLLNLYLPDNRKFRQLPRGKQHRASIDFEYQTLHAIIGRFGKEPVAFWDYLKGQKTIYRYEGRKKVQDHVEVLIDAKRRPELFPVAAELQRTEGGFFKKEMQYTDRHPRWDANGNPIRASHSLPMLARAAVQCYLDYCEKKADKIAVLTKEELVKECHRFDVRLGMALTHDAILKTVLHLDLSKWKSAYNYKEDCPWRERSLENGEGHIVTQIPFTNSFTSLRMKKACPNPKHFAYSYYKEGRIFDFNKFIRDGVMQKCSVSLREFYGTSPLLAMQKTGTIEGTAWLPELLEEHPKAGNIPNKKELDMAIRAIKDVHNQDILLLYVTQLYYGRFIVTETSHSDTEKKQYKANFDSDSTVFQFFNSTVEISLDAMRVRLRPNDRMRPVFSQIKDYAKKLYTALKDEQLQQELLQRQREHIGFVELKRVIDAINSNNQVIDFYDLVVIFRYLQASARVVRQNYMDKLMRLERSVKEPELPKDMPSEKKRLKLYKEVYLPRTPGKKKKMTFEEFNQLVEFRNKIYHKGSFFTNAECMVIDKVLRYFGIGISPR